MQRFTNTFSIRFYCRASRVGSDGTSPIELAINLQGERFISYLPRRAKPNEFQKLMSGRRTNDLREYLSAIEFRLRTLETICYKEGEPFTLEVWIYTRDGQQYRNRTGISLWEESLGPGFLRVHRSFLVNIADAALTAPDVVTVGTQEIPVSRKYKDSVKAVL